MSRKKNCINSEKLHSNLNKHVVSQPTNVKLVENPPMTAAITTSSFTGQSLDDPSPAKQVKLDLRATGLACG